MSYKYIKGYTVSSTAPDDITQPWIDTTIDYLGCNPIRFYIDGVWSTYDNAGQWYDTIGKVISQGRPYKIVASGQSNLGGSYTAGGDTTTCSYVSGWNDTIGQWVLAEIGNEPLQYSSGANYLHLLCKKIAEEQSRSVRFVTEPIGGTPLNCWSGNVGTPTGAGACYLSFTGKITNSGLTNPDLFIWGQGESGMGGPGTYVNAYYDKFIEFIEKLRTDNFIDATTFILAHGTGATDYGSVLVNSIGGDGDGGLRAAGANNDIYIDYVDVYGVTTDGLHFLPDGHEEIARRLFNRIKHMPIDKSTKMLGFDGLSTFKPFSGEQRLASTGLVLTNNTNIPYIDLASTDENTVFKGAEANATNQSSQGLTFNPISNNIVDLRHYNNTTSVQLQDTRVVITPDLQVPALTVYNGGDASIKLLDIGTTGFAWKLTSTALYNDLELRYNNNLKLVIDPTTGDLKLTSLKTTGAAPTTSGVTQFVTSDENGKLSFSNLNSKGIRKEAGDYTVVLSDYTISCNNEGNNVTITLPDPATCLGQIFIVKRYDESSIGDVGITSTAGFVQNRIGVFLGTAFLSTWFDSFNDKMTWQSNGTDWEYIQ